MTYVEDWERNVEPRLRWRCVGDIPAFPCKTLEEIRERVNSGDLALRIDYGLALSVAERAYGQRYAFTNAAIGFLPFLVALSLIVLAFYQKNYLLLIGVPLCILGTFLSSPYTRLTVLRVALTGSWFGPYGRAERLRLLWRLHSSSRLGLVDTFIRIAKTNLRPWPSIRRSYSSTCTNRVSWG